MNTVEQIVAGLLPVPEDSKIVDGELIHKTHREMYHNGIITVDDLALFQRAKRNQMLVDTDKYMIDDFPISDEDRKVIKVYRQTLRDITKQTDFPDIDIPSVPL